MYHMEVCTVKECRIVKCTAPRIRSPLVFVHTASKYASSVPGDGPGRTHCCTTW